MTLYGLEQLIQFLVLTIRWLVNHPYVDHQAPPRVRRSTFGARAFAIEGPTVWNSLPDSLRDPAVGPNQFRRDLKTHLFE